MENSPSYGYQSEYGTSKPTTPSSDSPSTSGYGYESGYGGAQTPQQAQPLYQQAADAINSAKDSIANSSVGQAVGKIGSVMGKAAQIAVPLTSIVTPGSGIPELAQSMAPQVAQAEGQAVSDYGLKKGYPITGAAVGTGVSMAPDLAAAYVGWNAIKGSQNPIVKGLVNTPQELGPEYQALDAKAGVSGKLAVQRGTIPKFPGLNGLPQQVPPPEAPNVAPSIYPKDTNTYLNFVRDRLDSVGKGITPQELSDHKEILKNIMDNMSAKGQNGTKAFAKAAQANTEIAGIQKINVPGRSSLDLANTIANNNPTVGDVASMVKRYGITGTKWAGTAGGVYYGAKNLIDYFKK